TISPLTIAGTSWWCVRKANRNRRSQNESAPNLDGNLSKASRQADPLPPHRRDIPRLYLAAARTSTKAGQHASRSSGYAGEELFFRRGHSAAAPCADHASRANLRQGGSS